MGILGAIGTAAKNILNTGTKVYSNVVSAISNPILKVANLPPTTPAKVAANPVTNTLGKAATVTAGALAVAVGTTTKAGIATVKALTPKSVIGKIAGGIGALTVLQTEKGIKTAGEIPEQAFDLTSNLASFVDDPSLEGAGKIVKDSPLVLGGLGVGALLSGGGLGLALNTLATKQNTDVTKEGLGKEGLGKEGLGKEGILGTNAIIPETSAGVLKSGALIPTTSKELQTDSSLPMSAETRSISVGRSKSKRKVKKDESPRINNRVNVLINNSNRSYSVKRVTERYLNN